MSDTTKTNQFVFKFIPITLNKISNKKQKTILVDRKCIVQFTLFLQTELAESHLIDIDFIQNKANFQNIDIYFQVKSDMEGSLDCTFKMLLKELPEINNTRDSRQSIKESLQQYGQVLLDLSIYIDMFKENGKRLFQENIQLSTKYTIHYQLFIEKTKHKLQRHIKNVKGNQGETNLFALAFKKPKGKPKVRYVEFDRDEEFSVKQEEFKKNKKYLISSLKKIGETYKPEKTVKANFNSGKSSQNNKNSSPHKYKLQHLHSDLDNRQSEDIDQHTKQSILQSSNQSLIEAYEHIQTVLLFNRPNLDNCLQKLSMLLFWIIALILLYLSMMPSIKI